MDRAASRPAWIADDTTQAHLLLTAVWVDDSDKRIRKMQAFTISPHATQALIKKARQVWTTPLPTQQAAAAMHAWAAAHPNPRGGKQAAFVTSRAGD